MNRYQVRITTGCHGRAMPPVLSTYSTRSAALRHAWESDRLEVYDTETGEITRCPPQGHPRHGSGRYGRPWPGLANLLQADRIPWARIVAEGHDLRQIARDARLHGDEELYRRALRAANRRGL